MFKNPHSNYCKPNLTNCKTILHTNIDDNIIFSLYFVVHNITYTKQIAVNKNVVSLLYSIS